jgi:hypothetical protein
MPTDPFDRAEVVDPFDAPPPDYSKVGNFDPPVTVGQGLRLGLAYFTTTDDQSRADIIAKTLPGATFEKDPEGNIIATYQGQTGYLNKPGFDPADMVDFASSVVKYLPAAKFGAGGANLATQIGRAGLAGGATSVAEDAAAMAQGSEQGIDPVKAAVTGAFSAGGQALSKPISAGLSWVSAQGRKVWDALRTQPQAVAPNGTLTAQGAAIAQQYGLDPGQMTRQLAAQLEAAARTATSAALPDEQIPAAVRNTALSNRFGVPLTRGQLTDDYAQQSLEENLAKMDVSSRAGTIIRGARDQADEAMLGANGNTGMGLLQREVAGPAAGADAATSGQTVMQATRARADAARAAYRDAYAQARDADAAMDSRAFKGFLAEIDDNLQNSEVGYDADLMPRTAKMLERLRGNAAWFEGMGSKAPRKIPLQDLEKTRKLINSLSREADATDRIGLSVLRTEFDDMVNRALDDGQVVGPTDAVQAWRTGRDLFRRYQQVFGEPARDAGRLEKGAQTEVVNWLRSDAATGETAIRGVLNNRALARRIIDVNGAGSPAHQAMKQGVMESIFRPALKNEGISPRLVVSRYETYFNGGYRENLATIFSSQERRAIGEFVQLARARIPQDGVVNTSNSTNALMKGIQQLGQVFGFVSGGPTGALAGAGIQAAAGARSTAQATAAVRGLPARQIAPLTGAAVGGATADQQR